MLPRLTWRNRTWPDSLPQRSNTFPTVDLHPVGASACWVTLLSVDHALCLIHNLDHCHTATGRGLLTGDNDGPTFTT
jgi:hypothetical protein